MGGAAIVALYPVTAAQARPHTIKGSLSLIHDIGEIMAEQGSAAASVISDKLDGKLMFKGRVRDVERRTEGGFTKGLLKFEGQGEWVGKTAEMEFQNEFLSIAVDGKITGTTPDLLTLLDTNSGQSVPTDLVKYGLALDVVGLPSPDVWTTPEGLELVGPRFFGIDTDYVSIQDDRAI